MDEWERRYTDDGDPSADAEVPSAPTRSLPPTIDYLSWRPDSPPLEEAADAGGDRPPLPEHVIEVCDFPASFTSRDLAVVFQEFAARGFDVRWVDDTHALAVFSSAACALEALQKRHPLVRSRPLWAASPQSRQKAERCVAGLLPYRPRPQTCALRARRMVATALGVRDHVSKEKLDLERRQLQQAKDKKRLAAKQKEDAWEGRF